MLPETHSHRDTPAPPTKDRRTEPVPSLSVMSPSLALHGVCFTCAWALWSGIMVCVSCDFVLSLILGQRGSARLDPGNVFFYLSNTPVHLLLYAGRRAGRWRQLAPSLLACQPWPGPRQGRFEFSPTVHQSCWERQGLAPSGQETFVKLSGGAPCFHVREESVCRGLGAGTWSPLHGSW